MRLQISFSRKRYLAFFAKVLVFILIKNIKMWFNMPLQTRFHSKHSFTLITFIIVIILRSQQFLLFFVWQSYMFSSLLFCDKFLSAEFALYHQNSFVIFYFNLVYKFIYGISRITFRPKFIFFTIFTLEYLIQHAVYFFRNLIFLFYLIRILGTPVQSLIVLTYRHIVKAIFIFLNAFVDGNDIFNSKILFCHLIHFFLIWFFLWFMHRIWKKIKKNYLLIKINKK